MLRNPTWMVCWAGCLWPVVAGVSVRAAGLGETLLPQSTKGFVSITDVEVLSEHWNQTQIGQLMNDPVMEPFAKDLRGQLKERLAGFQRRLGLTLEDLEDVPGGELTAAVAETAEGSRALVVLVDVTDHHEQAEAMLEKVSANLREQGATRSEKILSGTPVVVFDLPKDEEADPDEPPQQAVYFFKDDLLGTSDDLGVMEGILARLAGDEQGSLADVEAFQGVMRRCGEDAGDWTPQIRWFLEPIGHLQLMQAGALPRQPRRGKSKLDILKNQGFGAIQGGGGFVDFAVEGFDLLHRTAIFAPPPHEKSMKMLVFPNHDEFAPQPWVPREIATYASFYGDVMNAFDNFGALFDELFGEGETGVWADVLDSLEQDRNGPMIDLREELFAHLDNRVTVISDYQLPITTTSERLLFAVQTKNEKRVAAAIEKTLKDDEEVERREFKEFVIWETVPKEKPEVPTISLGAIPPLGGEEEIPEEELEQGEPLLPNAAVTVAHGQLMIASHFGFLIKVLEEIDDRETLSHDVEYRVVDDIISNKLEAPPACLRTFSRTEEEYRPAYELIRQGKMPESETMLGRVLNAIFGVDPEGNIRQQQIDGSKLPEYDFVRRYLSPAGMFGTSEENGWFLKGFMLSKESP